MLRGSYTAGVTTAASFSVGSSEKFRRYMSCCIPGQDMLAVHEAARCERLRAVRQVLSAESPVTCTKGAARHPTATKQQGLGVGLSQQLQRRTRSGLQQGHVSCRSAEQGPPGLSTVS